MPGSDPKRLSLALEDYRRRAAPATLLAAVQDAWPRAAGARIAAEADPVAERDGVVTIACRSATWAQELDLLSPELLTALADRLAGTPHEGALRALRVTADGARHIEP